LGDNDGRGDNLSEEESLPTEESKEGSTESRRYFNSCPDTTGNRGNTEILHRRREMGKLIVIPNSKAPETGSLYLRYKDGELGYIRFIPKCEMDLIKRDGIITRERRECFLTLLP